MNSLTENVDQFQHFYNKNRRIRLTNSAETQLSLSNYSNTKPLIDRAFDKIYTLNYLLPCKCDRAVLLKHPKHNGVLRCEKHLEYIAFVGKDLNDSKYFCLATQEPMTQAVADGIADLNRLEGYRRADQLNLFDMGEDL
jgi:hypothetical protein